MNEEQPTSRTTHTNVFVEIRAEDQRRDFEQTGRLDPQRFQRHLSERADDIREAIQEGARIVAASLSDLEVPGPWRVGEVSASFGIALGAEIGNAWIAKASSEATFNVEVRLVEQIK